MKLIIISIKAKNPYYCLKSPVYSIAVLALTSSLFTLSLLFTLLSHFGLLARSQAHQVHSFFRNIVVPTEIFFPKDLKGTSSLCSYFTQASLPSVAFLIYYFP